MKKNIFIIIQFLSLSRAISGLIFVTIALNIQYRSFASILYLYACLSDIVDGFLARRYRCSSLGGSILDLFGDKYLTIASLFFAAFKGIHPLPICILAFRELFLLTFRTLLSNGEFLIPTNRLFGGIYTFFLWSSTFILLLYSDSSALIIDITLYSYWIIGIIGLCNLGFRIKKYWSAIIKVFNLD